MWPLSSVRGFSSGVFFSRKIKIDCLVLQTVKLSKLSEFHLFPPNSHRNAPTSAFCVSIKFLHACFDFCCATSIYFPGSEYKIPSSMADLIFQHEFHNHDHQTFFEFKMPIFRRTHVSFTEHILDNVHEKMFL